MARVAIALAAALVLTGCATGVSTPFPSPPHPADSASFEPSAPGGAEGLEAALEAAGATVRSLGSFSPDPLRGEGTLLCVDGQEVRVYAYPTEADSAADASRIDPTDPSNFGTTMVSWAGSPRFWQRERLIVLYLGDQPAIEAGLTAILGEPFARAEARGPMQARNDC